MGRWCVKSNGLEIFHYFPCPNFGSLYLHIHYLFLWSPPNSLLVYMYSNTHYINATYNCCFYGISQIIQVLKKSGKCSNILVSLLVEIKIKNYFWIPYLSTHRIYYYLGTDINPRGSKNTQNKEKTRRSERMNKDLPKSKMNFFGK